MTNTALQTVQQFQQLVGSGNNDWPQLVADDISFTGPVDQVRGKADFITLNNNFIPCVRGYQPVSVLEQGNRVLLEGVFTIAAPSGKEIQCHLAEIYELKNGKIQNIRVYYDAEEFRKEFGRCQ